MIDRRRFLPLGIVAVSRTVGELARRGRSFVHLARRREAALLTVRIESAKEEERRRLARDLHDELGTNLTATKLLLELIADSPSTADRHKRVGEAIALVDRMISHSRALSIDLRPPLLDELGLPAALRSHVDGVARLNRVSIELDTEGVPERLPDGTSIAVFRVVQESLTNVVRHAGAQHAAVAVRHESGELHIRVNDDGKGFDVATVLARAARGEHAGLAGMRERIESMGGHMSIRAGPGKGTRIDARLPLGV